MLGGYRKLEKEHVKKIQAWLDADPKNLEGLHNHIGEDRTPADYVAEYSDRFAIAAHLASDIGMPNKIVNAMYKEYHQYSDLEGEVFGN